MSRYVQFPRTLADGSVVEVEICIAGHDLDIAVEGAVTKARRSKLTSIRNGVVQIRFIKEPPKDPRQLVLWKEPARSELEVGRKTLEETR